MITVRHYIDDSINLDIRVDKGIDDKFDVICVCESMTEQQAKNFFEFIVRPFFYDLNVCGLKPAYINKDLFKNESV